MLFQVLSKIEQYFSLKYGLLFSALLLAALYLHTHGFPTADEGWILQASKRLVSGEKIYRDFQFIYHPGVLYLNAAAFKILGISVLTSRMVALVNTLVSLFLLLYLSRKNNFSFVLSSLVLAGFLFWGAGHINFSWPVMFCITTGLANVAAWTAWFSRKKSKYMILSGVTVALTLLLKQNFGLAIFIVNIFCIIIFTDKSRLKVIRQFLLGFCTVLGIQLLYFWLTDTLWAYVNDMRYLLIERIFLKGVLNSELPWHYPGPMLYRMAKVGLYNLPLLISLIALFIAWKKKNKSVVYYCLVVVSYYILSIRPTTDYIHLTPLLAIAFFPLAYILYMFQNKWFKIAGILAMCIFVLIGAYSAVFKNYYRWDSPLISQNQFSVDPHVLISVEPSAQKTIEWFGNFSGITSQEKYLFVYSFSPQFNFFSDKVNPTRFDYLHTGVLSPEIENEVIGEVKSKNVRFVLTDVKMELEKDSIAQFVRSNYTPISSSGKYTIWQKSD